MTLHNTHLAEIFEDMGVRYELEGPQHQFRARAYLNAAKLLRELSEDISYYMQDGHLKKINGIGEGIAKKIKEYLQTGKISHYESLKKKLPQDFISLVEVKGLGTETLRRLHQELGINSREGLVKALHNGSIEKLEGFGPKKVENILAGLQQKQIAEQTIRLWNALVLGKSIVEKLNKLSEVQQAEIAGSLRRKKETVGDVDILVAATKENWSKIIDAFVSFENVESVVAKGDTKASVMIRDYNRQVDMRIVESAAWGAALVYFTGSKEHNVHLRQLALDKGFKLNEYGLFKTETEQKVAGKTEDEVYQKLGLSWLPPEMRENRGEIELAAAGNIPKLVELKDIIGDMHMHSTYSDGKHSLEEIVSHLKENYAYEYIVVTDHSKSTRVAGGMNEKGFLKQIAAIQELNSRLGEDFIKAGAEVDILSDGSMDLPDELLSQLDWVIASIHAQFKEDNTDRLIKACENPYVHVLGHPSGRLIGVREGYPLDMEEVIKAAKVTGTAMEINAQPKRMDLNDHWARRAREQGVPLVISTDSHSFDNYAFLNLGVYVARRAWCRAQDILNTRPWKEIVDFKNSKAKLLG